VITKDLLKNFENWSISDNVTKLGAD